MTKQYLGDSVYVEVEGGMFKLTTENGDGPSNTIYLEPEVYIALKAYADPLLYPPVDARVIPEDER